MHTHVFRLVYLVLTATALCILLYWYGLGRPVAMPDAAVDKLNCVSYSPFHLAGQTPFDRDLVITPAQIEADLSALAQQFSCVRTYSVDQGLDIVPAMAQKLGMQVYLGIWIGRDAVINAHEIELGTRLAKEFPMVIRGLIVGNEVLMRREQTPAKLREILANVRGRVPGMPVSYADSWDFWLRYQHELANSVSFATIHILPFWDDDTVAVEDAAQYVADMYHKVQTEMGGKPLLIGETGWPSYGRQRQDAPASLRGQTRFIREFSAVAKAEAIPYNIIEAFDQPWKRRSEGAVGGYWGMFSADSKAKFPLHGPVAEAPQWRNLAFTMMPLLFGLFAFLHWKRQGLNWAIVWVQLPLSISGAGASVAYWRDMWMSNRSLLEWGYSGFFALALLLTSYTFARIISDWVSGVSNALSSTEPASSYYYPAWLFGLRLDSKRHTLGQVSMQPSFYDTFNANLRRLFLFAATVVCLLLVFDLRNRDYPLALFSVPAIGWFLLACIGRQKDIVLEEKICAIWIGFAGLWLPVIEHLIFRPDMSCYFADGININVFYWSGICLLLSGSVILLRGQAHK